MVEVVFARGVGGLLATSKDDLVDSSKACFFFLPAIVVDPAIVVAQPRGLNMRDCIDHLQSDKSTIR